MSYGRIVAYCAEEQVVTWQSDVAATRRRRLERSLLGGREPGDRRWPDPLERLGGLIMQAGRFFGGGGGPMSPSAA
jgi:hypothetical protein